MNNGIRIREFVVLLIAICSTFLYGCNTPETDNVSYDIEQTTGDIVNSRVDTYVTMAGKVATTHHDYYVTVKAKDGTETEFKSSSLYDTYNEEAGTQTIDFYKLTEYKNRKVEKITYQLTDEVPANSATLISCLAIIVVIAGMIIFLYLEKYLFT